MYAADDNDNKYSVGNEGGSKDAVAVSHTHNATAESNEVSLTTSGTVHEDNINKEKTLLSALYTGRGEYGRYIHLVGKDLHDNAWDKNKCIHVDSGQENYDTLDFKMQEIQVRPNQ